MAVGLVTLHIINQCDMLTATSFGTCGTYIFVFTVFYIFSNHELSGKVLYKSI